MCLHHHKLKTMNKIITFVYEDYLFIMSVVFFCVCEQTVQQKCARSDTMTF